MKRTTASTILFAGDDPAFADLVKRFNPQKYAAVHAVDGNLALQKALELKPSLVVIDAALQPLSASRFAQILRTNCQSNDLTLVFVGAEGEEIDGFVRHRDIFLSRPLNFSQVGAYVEKHFLRLEQAQQLLQQKQEVKGSLDQLGITDLLQLFALNGKSGTLLLTRGVDRGRVLLENGQVVNAQLGRVEAEKALYRLILWRYGTFRFCPGPVDGPVRITAPTDHLIMEGLRLGDEMAAQAASLPALHSRMQLAIPRERFPQGLRAATREILLKLEGYPCVNDLLDHCSQSDLQILQLLRVLREKGVIREQPDEDGTDTVPLLSAAEVLAVHQSLYGSTRIGESLSAIVVLLSPSPWELSEFLPVLQKLPGFVPSVLEADDPRLPVELGRLQISENFTLRFSVVPAAAEFSPLWAFYARQLFGVIALAADGSFPVAEKVFSSTGTVLVFLDPPARATLASDGRKAWRELFCRFLPRFQTGLSKMEVP